MGQCKEPWRFEHLNSIYYCILAQGHTPPHVIEGGGDEVHEKVAELAEKLARLRKARRRAAR